MASKAQEKTKENPFGGPRGDVKQGFAEADVTVEGEFRTQVQTHSALETHGIVADWKPEGLTVYMQGREGEENSPLPLGQYAN